MTRADLTKDPQAVAAMFDNVAEGYDRTTAELSVEEKDAISHRGRALRELAPIVAKALGD